jgi:hypothetical protein
MMEMPRMIVRKIALEAQTTGECDSAHSDLILLADRDFVGTLQYWMFSPFSDDSLSEGEENDADLFDSDARNGKKEDAEEFPPGVGQIAQNAAQFPVEGDEVPANLRLRGLVRT